MFRNGGGNVTFGVRDTNNGPYVSATDISLVYCRDLNKNHQRHLEVYLRYSIRY